MEQNIALQQQQMLEEAEEPMALNAAFTPDDVEKKEVAYRVKPAKQPAPSPAPSPPPSDRAASFADVQAVAEPEPAPVSPSEAASVPVPVEQVEKIAQRVVAQVSEKIVREIAWEVVPDLAEALIKQEIERLKAELEKL